MRIGILTHCVANNFGANLQALSTGFYLKNRGFDVVYICWAEYLKNKTFNMLAEQLALHTSFLRRNGFEVSQPCVNDDDFRNLIKEKKIGTIIVGADAVLTVKPWIANLIIGRKGIRHIPLQKDYIFPNPFWLNFANGMNIKRFLMSPSCQSSNYKMLPKRIKVGMKEQLEKFDYVSARDLYTQKMIYDITKGSITCSITPDPVFNFRNNVSVVLPKQYIVNKFSLPDNYLLVSFFDYCMPSECWFRDLQNNAMERGLVCVHLPMPEGSANRGLRHEIKLPIDPLEWFYIIKYAQGYIGNNMHPIIVSIVNDTPFYSIDQHGKYFLQGKMQLSKTSKVYDLLKSLDLLEYWIPMKKYKSISTKVLINKILNWDHHKVEKAYTKMQLKYCSMMESIVDLIKRD